LREFFPHPDDVKTAGMRGALGDQRIIVQSLGNVGYYAASILQNEDGARITAVIERDGALLNNKGLDIEALHLHINEHKTIRRFEGATYSENGPAALELDCDILIPAALESQITVHNAERIKASLIAEAANGPITFAADEIIRKRGTVVIPDAYVNAGGVTVSYFEWVRNLAHIRFGRMERRHDELRGKELLSAMESLSGKTLPEPIRNEIVKGADEFDLVRSGLDDTMRLAYQELHTEFHSNPKIDDFRTAAYTVAVRKIARSYVDIGVY
jgi:glutamate dehydrogenase (NAD(P)+)